MEETHDNSTTDELVEQCADILQYEFQDTDLLQQCCTHASLAATRLESNERLEFLGDAILGAVVSEELFRRHPELPEGDLTRMKSVIVSRETCARTTRRIGLDDVVRLGKGVRMQQQVPSSILAAIYESVVGGVFLDGGFGAAHDVILRTMQPEFAAVLRDESQNFKSALQQLAQKDFAETPSYRLMDEQGPDHSKCFKVAAFLGERQFTAAWGNSKKQAEQRAAENALSELEGQPAPHSSD